MGKAEKITYRISLFNLIRSSADQRTPLRRTSVSGNLANSKSISDDIDRGPAERRANKSIDDGVRQVNWLEPLSRKARRRDTGPGEKQFSSVIDSS